MIKTERTVWLEEGTGDVLVETTQMLVEWRIIPAVVNREKAAELLKALFDAMGTCPERSDVAQYIHEVIQEETCLPT